MTRHAVAAAMLAACIGAVGCTTYNPATGTYETDPVGTSLVAGGLGMAGGVALGAALADNNDCCWGGGWGGGWGHNDVNIHNQYNRTVNYNKNKNVNRNRTNYRGGGGGGYGGGGYRGGGGRGGGGRGGGGRGGGGRR